VKKTMYTEAYNTLKGYHVSDKDADYIAGTVSDAYIAHYDGDEDTDNHAAIDTSKLSLWGRLIYSQYAYVIDGLWVDLKPADSNITFSLSSAS